MSYEAALALAVGLGVSIAVLSAAIGQGRTATSALEAIARQPDAVADIQRVMLIALALIESLVIYTFVLALILMGKLAPVLEVIRARVGGG
ncbi:MAG: ATP synthase F0 subunit C [Armatimonadetes bacterium]|nr:ATP synthase F0 subunit C [Armatimonadota bacterium]